MGEVVRDGVVALLGVDSAFSGKGSSGWLSASWYVVVSVSEGPATEGGI